MDAPALVNSFLLVAASEMGDKTQLLAFVLASRFKKPWAIMAGILVATLANHALASAVGGYVGSLFSPDVLRYVLAAIFIGFGLWILVPDKDDVTAGEGSRWGAFATTTLLFFLAEMGDKTQLATVALGARYQEPLLVTAGTTLGMLFADGLAVVFGERVARVIPMKKMRIAACVMFLFFGVGVLLWKG